MPDPDPLTKAVARPHRVLVIEDEDNVALALEYVIRRQGHDFHRIADGAEAYDALQDIRPDVVLLDVMLPNVSGFEICDRLRRDPDLSQTRVIIMTARGSAAQRDHAMSVGANDFLPKPFSLDDLRSKLKDQLRQP